MPSIRMVRVVVILLLLIAFGNKVDGQVWKKSSQSFFNLANYAVKSYSTKEGLPSKNATSALKDRRGFMWIGTSNGLCRFDGYTFKVFANQAGDTTTISNNYVNALAEAHDGKIWVGTMDGLNLFDPVTEKFTRFYHTEKDPRSLSNNKVWSVLADHLNQVWIGTDDGFNHYLRATKKFAIYRPDSKKPFAMKGKSVNAVIEDSNHNLWLGNWSGGLNKFDRKSSRFTNFRQPQAPNNKNPNDVWSLKLGHDGTIWVGTYWKGLFNFNPHTQTYRAYPCPDLENISVFSIQTYQSDRLLLGGNAGFYWLDLKNGDWKKIDRLTSYANGDVYQDTNGILWLCSNDGLIKVDARQYKFNFRPCELGQHSVKSLLVHDSTIWMGTSNGLFEYNFQQGKTNLFTHTANPTSIASSDISKLYIDTHKQLWILTENGFDRYNEKDHTFSHHSHHSALGSLFNEDVFRDILEVYPGEYWLATDAGLKVYHSAANTFSHYFNDPAKPYSISNNHLYCLLKDSEGYVWIGTYGGGLNRFDPKTGRFYAYMVNGQKRGSISNNIITSLFLDSRHNIWICTPDGLNRYDRKTNTFIIYSKNNGFASNEINDLTEDKKGNLWVLTGAGLSRFNPLTLEVKNFDEADGVFANERISTGPGGDIYLGGLRGLLHFNPATLNLNNEQPPIYFTDFQVFNKSVVPGRNSPLKQNINEADVITIPYNQSVFSLEFVALNYTHTEKNEYAFFLEGFDQKWNYVGQQRKATYTNLNPGKYIFHVIGSNNDGKWNRKGKAIYIVITPPWYLTWWACAFYAIATVGVVYLYVLYKARQAKLKYEIQLAHVESEKEKELNEKKLSFFTNISHEFRTPLTLIINPVKELLYRDDKNVDTTNLNIVYRNARRLLSLVDQLLLFRKAGAEADSLKISKANVVDLAKEVFLCFTHQTRSKQIKFEFVSDKEEIELYVDREKIEIVLFNLLSNAIKFTPAGGTISLTLLENENDVLIEVADSGCGIPEHIGEKLYSRFYQEPHQNNSLKGGFGIGLYLVKSFIDSHQGLISYQSQLNEGTTFSIWLPKGKQHMDADLIFEGTATSSVFLKELIEDEISANATVEAAIEPAFEAPLTSEAKSLLIVDDNDEIREYIKQVFKLDFLILEASDGRQGLELIKETVPDIIISDVLMPGMSGIELCNLVKEDTAISHIPIILLTASSSPEIKLKGIEGGADDYISKPFDKEILQARVASLLKSRNNLQQYFYNEITLNHTTLKISPEYKEFLQNCIDIVEQHLTDSDFSIQVLASEIGMSRSNLYKRVKFISGQSSNGFIRFIRLRKAAELFIHTNNTITETAYQVGINDPKYFREQFSKLFNMNPSQYIKKYRKPIFYQSSVLPDFKRHGKKAAAK